MEATQQLSFTQKSNYINLYTLILPISKYSESKQRGWETEGCNDEHLADCLSVILCDTAHEVMSNMWKITNSFWEVQKTPLSE